MKTTNFIRLAVSGSALLLSLTANAQMHINAQGRVGIGTTSPLEALHVERAGAQLVVANTAVDPGAKTLLHVMNDGAAEFKLSDLKKGRTWNLSATGRLDFRNKNRSILASLKGNGNLVVKGSIITGGVTCGGGCDLVFDPANPPETIEEHAAEMWEKRHLPAVGPTLENAPINLSEKTGRMLNELEKAHIYIEQLHKRLAELEQQNQRIEELLTRMMTANMQQVAAN